MLHKCIIFLYFTVNVILYQISFQLFYFPFLDSKIDRILLELKCEKLTSTKTAVVVVVEVVVVVVVVVVVA